MRAAGGANARNPLPIVVPCHRVVGARGDLTGDSGELARQRAPLAREAGPGDLVVFQRSTTRRAFGDALPAGADQDATVAAVLSALEIEEIPVEVYEPSETELDVVLDRRTLHVDLASGEVFEEGQEPRFLLRAANWLHLNRGKAAWTYVADGFAVLLLFLATSGLFMLPGRKGLLGRGGVLVLIGAAVPVLYVLLS